MENYYIFKNIVIENNNADDVSIIKITVKAVDTDGYIHDMGNISYADSAPVEYDLTKFFHDIFLYCNDGKYHDKEFYEKIIENSFLNCIMYKSIPNN